ncbi:DUF2380 domain-containing protein [Arenibaculum pallidiluteum]|uniref:DUF2380 domain-containing protein n=1 Tax=Arenibaculum pallidiluteum TaxID=2812559 RepID=UPI001A97AFB1|nr:DUF2380 domain-containing protein [Arenibaculum pallidiluteum]
MAGPLQPRFPTVVRILARALACASLAVPIVATAQGSGAQGAGVAGPGEGIAVAIVEFANQDTAGEDGERTASHAARVRDFSGLLGRTLAARGRFKVVALPCPGAGCPSAGTTFQEVLQEARGSGAKLLVHGGIHKMSTLVQWGAVEAVDVERGQPVLERSFSFRGDTDEAFRRAAEFIARYFEALPAAR